MVQELELLDQVKAHIERLEERILERVEFTKTIRLVKTLPGVGKILSIVIEREMGCVDRFPSSENFASYAGTASLVRYSEWLGRSSIKFPLSNPFPSPLFSIAPDSELRTPL